MTRAGLVTIIDPVSLQPAILSEYIDRLSPRDAIEGELYNYPGVDPLHISRNIIDCRGYTYLGVPFPGTDLLVNPTNPSLNGIAPNAQVDGSIVVPVGSVLITITASTLQSDGFDFRIFDKSTGKDFFFGEFASNYMVGQYNSLVDPALPPIDTRLDGILIGQRFLPTPVVVVGNGEFLISVRNRSPNYNICQVYLEFAVPGSYTNTAFAAMDFTESS